MTEPFNLIDQPWIPCLRHNGERIELSLHDTLAQAHLLREIWSDSPLETASLHRLLLVILHRSFGPSGVQAWLQLWKNKDNGFAMTAVNKHFTKWHHKFNLFDEQHPFFQVVDESQVKEFAPVNKMIPQLTADTTLFEHTSSDSNNGAVLSFARTARVLITAQNYGLGYNYFVNGPCTLGIVFLILGETLYETLLLNLVKYPQDTGDYYSGPDDAPAWEMETPFVPIVDGRPLSRDVKRQMKNGKIELIYDYHTPLGQLDYLTWHNRKIKLRPSTDKQEVRQVAWAPGARIKNDVLDPMQSYRSREEKGWQVLGCSKDRAVWRDIDVLLKLTEDEKKIKPLAALSWLSRISRQYKGVLAKTYRLAAFGMAKEDPSSAKIEFIRSEVTPLPVKYLEVDHLQNDLTTELKLADKVNKLLNHSTFLLVWLTRIPGTKDEKFDKSDTNVEEQNLIGNKLKDGQNTKTKDREALQVYQLFSSFGVESHYWSQLEVHFHRFLQDLPQNRDTAQTVWRNQLKQVAWAVFTQAQNHARSDRRAQRAMIKADEHFRRGLAKLLNVPDIDLLDEGELTDE